MTLPSLSLSLLHRPQVFMQFLAFFDSASSQTPASLIFLQSFLFFLSLHFLPVEPPLPPSSSLSVLPLSSLSLLSSLPSSLSLPSLSLSLLHRPQVFMQFLAFF